MGKGETPLLVELVISDVQGAIGIQRDRHPGDLILQDGRGGRGDSWSALVGNAAVYKVGDTWDVRGGM